MATLREIARVTKTRGDLPDVSGGELKNNAWLLYTAVLEEAQRTGTVSTEGGIAGYRWRGHVKTVMRSLWRGILPGMENQKDARASRVQELLYRYLRETGNLRLIERGLKEPSLWWVRKEWNDQAPKPAENSRQLQAQRREARVSAQEAGEDRVPSLVELKYKCPHCDKRFASKVRRSAHIFTFGKHESLEDWMVRGLKEAEVPAGPTDVFRIIERQGFLGSLALVNDGLRDMSRDRKGPVVVAQVPGRDRVTYALRSRLHEMKPVSYYAPSCREPGCGAGPFKNTDARIRHELEEHGDSANRRYECSICGWKGYDGGGLNMHLLRSHADITNDDRLAIMELAGQRADKVATRVLVEPWGDQYTPGLLKDSRGQITLIEDDQPQVEISQPAVPKPAPPPPSRPQAVDIVVDSGSAGEPKVMRGDPMEMMIKAATLISMELQQLRTENKDLRTQNKRLRKLEKLQEMLKDLDEDE